MMMNLTQIVVSTLNRYLDLDPERAAALAAIDHKVIKLFIRELDKALTIQVENLRAHEVAGNDMAVDVNINLSLKALPELALGVDQNQLIKQGRIEINGDAHVASVLQNVLREIEIDWQEQLSKYTGDALAYQAGKAVKQAHSFGRRLSNNLRADLRDYMRDEMQITATREEVDTFVQEVDAVRAQTDRLEARIKRLQAKS